MADPFEIKPGTKCRKCGERQATIRWGGGDPTFALTPGFWVPWCERCALEAQLEHAQEMVKKIPMLEEQLAALE